MRPCQGKKPHFDKGLYLGLGCSGIEGKELPSPTGKRGTPQSLSTLGKKLGLYGPSLLPSIPEHKIVHTVDSELVSGIDW